MRGCSLLVSLLALIACAVQASAPESLTVMVSIPPQVEVVERISAGAVTVEVLIPPGRSPTTYEPSPRQLATLAHADVLIPVGVPFERQVIRRVSTIAPELSLCGEPLPDQGSDADHSPGDRGAGDAAHDHGTGPDPHFWLDPMQASEHAERVCRCLCAAAPDSCESFRSNLKTYQSELEAIDHTIHGQLAPLAGATMLVFHPAFGHFATRYGLRQLAIERDGKEPTGRHLAEVINRADDLDIRVIFVQPQIVAPSVRAVADAIGATIVNIDPLAPDLAANIQRIADTVAREFGHTTGEQP